MAKSLESRFEAYCDEMVKALAHIDRRTPARWYLQGLMLPGSRKSVEPMAARVHPEDVRSAHQSMHHLVAQSDWSDAALLAAVAAEVLPTLTRAHSSTSVLIVDDTGFAKKGVHSVGVAHQYCGQLGKTANCRVAVSVSVANDAGSLPIGFRLYLPREWTDDRSRCEHVGVPERIGFQTKNEIARTLIADALKAGIAFGTILADAAYGDETDLRDWLTTQGLAYAMGVRPATTLWWGDHQPVPDPTPGTRGKARHTLVRDPEHKPISAAALAQALPRNNFRKVTWREGSAAPLSSRFARVRVRAAHRDYPRAEEWLIIEWPANEELPTRYWLSTLPAATSMCKLVDTIKARWRIERDYQELKQEFGLGHFEGRNWRGFHHHISLCIAAYGFLMRERLIAGKKNAARFRSPPIPEGFRPRGSVADATSSAGLDCDTALPIGQTHRANPRPLPVLRSGASTCHSHLITQ